MSINHAVIRSLVIGIRYCCYDDGYLLNSIKNV